MFTGEINIKRFNENGELEIEVDKLPMNSLTMNALDCFGTIFGNTTNTSFTYTNRLGKTVTYPIVDVDGNSFYSQSWYFTGFGSRMSWPAYFLGNANNISQSIGINIGTASNAWSISDNQLYGKCNYSANNVLAYPHHKWATASNVSNPLDSCTFNTASNVWEMNQISRKFYNSSSENIILNEIGIYINGAWRMTYGNTQYTDRTVCIVRDVLSESFEFTTGSTIEISYRFKFSPKINNQIMGMILGIFWPISYMWTIYDGYNQQSANEQNPKYWRVARCSNTGNIENYSYVNYTGLTHERNSTYIDCSSSWGLIMHSLPSNYPTANSGYKSCAGMWNIFHNQATSNSLSLTWSVLSSGLGGTAWTMYNTTTNDYTYGIIPGYDGRENITQAEIAKDYTDVPNVSCWRCNTLTAYAMREYSQLVNYNDIYNSGYSGTKMSRLFKNNSLSNVTINYFAIVSKQPNTKYTNLYWLVYKELLATPIVLRPGDSIFYEFDYRVYPH